MREPKRAASTWTSPTSTASRSASSPLGGRRRGHHLLFNGPKGSGKTSLVERLPGILPDLSRSESLELTVLHSLAGSLQGSAGLLTRPPYLAPHHAASGAALLGGGSGRVRPGAVSLAHLGVLFLDELPLFRTDVIDGLREPLESGEITVARGDEVATYPARSIVVAAANPCPCGNHGVRLRDHRCECDAVTIRNYTRRLRGPVLDRIDIQVTVRPERLRSGDQDGRETSAQVRERVQQARTGRQRVMPDVPGGSTGTCRPRCSPASGRCRREVRATWTPRCWPVA